MEYKSVAECHNSNAEGFPPMSESKYEEILAILAERIDDGYYFREGRDGQMDTMAHMRSEFGVGNTTLRTALAILKDRGVVRSHQGKSWFVVTRSASRQIDAISSRVSAERDQANGSTST